MQRLIPAFYASAIKGESATKEPKYRSTKDKPIWHVKTGKLGGFYRRAAAKPGPVVYVK
jgi:hypothetical protein